MIVAPRCGAKQHELRVGELDGHPLTLSRCAGSVDPAPSLTRAPDRDDPPGLSLPQRLAPLTHTCSVSRRKPVFSRERNATKSILLVTSLRTRPSIPSPTALTVG